MDGCLPAAATPPTAAKVPACSTSLGALTAVVLAACPPPGRSRGCLKLGWGLVHDLRAIAAALGGEGGSCIAGAWALLEQRAHVCVCCFTESRGCLAKLPYLAARCIPAVVDPACDLGSMHRFLRHRGARGVHKACRCLGRLLAHAPAGAEALVSHAGAPSPHAHRHHHHHHAPPHTLHACRLST